MPTSFPDRASFDAVCFDAFGTLVEITNPRHFTRKLLGAVHRSVRRELKFRVLREDRPIDYWPKAMGSYWCDGETSKLSDNLCAELASIQMRPAINEMWRKLRQQGFKLGVCSNLAAPYGLPVLNRLPDNPDAVTFSYLVGHAKPEPAIYAKVMDNLGLPAERILFVGDSVSADVDGPAMAGMASILVNEFVTKATASPVT